MVAGVLAAGVLAAAASASAATSGPQAARTAALTGVSCGGAGRCLAVGFAGTGFRPPALAESWNGARWRLAAQPHLRSPVSVDCVSPSFCVAIGIANSGGKGATAVWNGTRWTAGHGTAPVAIGALSCASKTFCVDAGVAGPLQQWNGASWQNMTLPRPPGSTDFTLSGVSCPSAGFCMAVGASTTDPDSLIPQTVAETWNGSSWQLIPSPTHTKTSSFSAVSCTSSSHCVAVGAFFTAARPTYQAFNVAAVWNGTTWQVTRLPGPVGFPYGFDHLSQGPESISCATATSCMTVGSFTNARTRQPDSVAIAWNGAKWQLTSLAGPRTGIVSVSCPLANRCMAVGRNGKSTLAERWNGTRWTLLSTPRV